MVLSYELSANSILLTSASELQGLLIAEPTSSLHFITFCTPMYIYFRHVAIWVMGIGDYNIFGLGHVCFIAVKRSSGLPSPQKKEKDAVL